MPTVDCRHGPEDMVTNWQCEHCGDMRHGCRHECAVEVIVASKWEDRKVASTPAVCIECGDKVALAPSTVARMGTSPDAIVKCTDCGMPPRGAKMVIGHAQQLEIIAHMGKEGLDAAIRQLERRGVEVILE